MQHQDFGETIAMTMFFIFFAIMIGHGLRHLITGQPPSFTVRLKTEAVRDQQRHLDHLVQQGRDTDLRDYVLRGNREWAERMGRAPAAPADGDPFDSIGGLAGAAQRMGISEEQLRQWLAAGWITLQDTPGQTRH